MKRYFHFIYLTCISILAILILAGCSRGDSETTASTNTPKPSPTSAPTNTPKPSPTNAPTNTPKPGPTSPPANTPNPVQNIIW